MLGILSQQEIDDVLRAAAIGRIGCHAMGRTYVVPTLYAYDGESIYGHAVEGMRVRYMRANPEVCFEVDEVRDLTDWRSVIASGRYEELHGQAAGTALTLLATRFESQGLFLAPASSYATHRSLSLTGEERSQAVVYRLHLTERTGRFSRP